MEIARKRGDDARHSGMADVPEATLDRWFTAPFRAAGKDRPVRERLLSDDPNGWAAAWYAKGDVHTLPRLSPLRANTTNLRRPRSYSG